MALSYSNLGIVDPPAVTLGESSQKTDLRMVCGDITLNQTDYVGTNGGITIHASAFSTLGLNTVLFAAGHVRASSGTVDSAQVLVWDANLSGLRGLEIAASTVTAFSEVTSADFADGDIVRVVAVGR